MYMKGVSSADSVCVSVFVCVCACCVCVIRKKERENASMNGRDFPDGSCEESPWHGSLHLLC